MFLFKYEWRALFLLGFAISQAGAIPTDENWDETDRRTRHICLARLGGTNEQRGICLGWLDTYEGEPYGREDDLLGRCFLGIYTNFGQWRFDLLWFHLS